MPRVGLKYEQVAQAADRLLAAGIFPSIRQVRLVLGTGSANTISAHLHRWQHLRNPELHYAKQAPRVQTIYSVPSPGCDGGLVDVYGVPSQGWYEFRVIHNGEVVSDTGLESSVAFQGRQYGSPESALRDALMVASDLPDPYHR